MGAGTSGFGGGGAGEAGATGATGTSFLQADNPKSNRTVPNKIIFFMILILKINIPKVTHLKIDYCQIAKK
ncbi:hypothetical protein FNO01nite_16570 [Flavobacterium noncentrifugens]|nr:hypothetical protein FNO01nite_16570 [Flavobacterium noncentrifugens]